MKTKLLGLITLALVAAQGLKAEAYVLNATNEERFSTINSQEYDLDGRPAGFLTFEAKCVAIAFFWGGDLHIDQYVNGTWSNIGTVGFSQKDTYYNFGPFELDRNATKVKLYTKSGATGYKYMRNVKVTMASYVESAQSKLVMPETELTTSTTASFTVSHSNVAQLNVSTRNNALFTPDITTITGSGEGKYGTAAITITYKPTAAGTHLDTVTIGNGTQTLRVPVQGTAVKRKQSIVWQENIDVVAQGATLENAAIATSGLAVSYASENPSVMAVENGKLVAKAAGQVAITATQAGDDQWQAVSDTKTFTVTTLEVQTITWNQNLLLLRLGDEPLTLNAQASSGLAISYVSSDENVVSVSGNTLTIVGVGETTLTATQAGNSVYAPASLTKSVRVRQVSTGCDEVALADPNSYTNGSHTIDLPRPGALLSFDLYLPGSATGELRVWENFADGSRNLLLEITSLYQLTNAFTGKTIAYKDMALNHKAVSLTFAFSDGTLDKTISNIFVTQATYLETEPVAINAEVGAGSVYNGTLAVNYSNLPDIIMVSQTNNAFTLSGGDHFGNGCGDFGTQTINISYQSEQMGEVADTIVLTCASQIVRVPVLLNVRKQNQAIQWDQDLSGVTIQDTIPLTATSSSGLEIAYESSNTAVAVILDGNKLAFAGEGEAEIKAMQAGNDYFEAAQSMTKTVSVSRLLPTIVSLPAAKDLTYGQTLSESELTGGEASVSGTFVWEDGSIAPNAGAAQRYAVMFIPEKQALYETLIDSVAVNVAKQQQQITWAQDLMLINSGDTVLLTGFASSGLAVSYSSESASISLTNDTLVALFAGNGTITASQAGNENYLSAEPITLNFSVLPRDVRITTIPVASDITYGQTLSRSELTGGEATIPGTFQWKDATHRPDAGTKAHDVLFVPENENESTILLAVSLTVHKAAQTVIWEQDLSAVHVGDTLELDAETSSGMPVTYVVGDTTVLNVVGNRLIALKVGRTSILATQEGNENYEEADGVRLYVTVNQQPTALSTTNLLQGLRVFPNPATDVLNISLSEPISEIRLYDAAGRLALTAQPDGAQNVVLQVGTLPRGLYQVYVRTEKGGATQRIICR